MYWAIEWSMSFFEEEVATAFELQRLRDLDIETLN
jgi:hypothetical protein